MLIRRRGGRSKGKGTVKRRLCLSMQCKYLHSSNEHLSSNLKLPLENICNFVAKKQKESKGETRRRRERNTSIFYTFAVRQSLRFPPLPGCGFDKKLKHFAVSPNVSSSPLGAAHTQTAREAGPNQAANLGHRVLFMCVMPWRTSPFQSSHTTHTHRDTLTCVFTSGHGHCLAAAAFTTFTAFASLPPP